MKKLCFLNLKVILSCDRTARGCDEKRGQFTRGVTSAEESSLLRGRERRSGWPAGWQRGSHALSYYTSSSSSRRESVITFTALANRSRTRSRTPLIQQPVVHNHTQKERFFIHSFILAVAARSLDLARRKPCALTLTVCQCPLLFLSQPNGHFFTFGHLYNI